VHCFALARHKFYVYLQRNGRLFEEASCKPPCLTPNARANSSKSASMQIIPCSLNLPQFLWFSGARPTTYPTANCRSAVLEDVSLQGALGCSSCHNAMGSQPTPSCACGKLCSQHNKSAAHEVGLTRPLTGEQPRPTHSGEGNTTPSAFSSGWTVGSIDGRRKLQQKISPA